ncbi:MAG: hypothetical protein K0S14_2550 [Thermomicrobiales bacterium]|nr:hypothetical protein [Thermomicrobiales bacterium]
MLFADSGGFAFNLVVFDSRALDRRAFTLVGFVGFRASRFRMVDANSADAGENPGGTSLALRASAPPTMSSSAMTTNVMNSELVTRRGPTVKRVSGAIAMWISIPGRYSSSLSRSSRIADVF